MNIKKEIKKLKSEEWKRKILESKEIDMYELSQYLERNGELWLYEDIKWFLIERKAKLI